MPQIASDGRGPRNLVVLSDGTGNSSAALQKTNVWRLYQALDLGEPGTDTPGAPKQLAYYDNGVGTSSFKPLAILGGVMGWGLKRNIRDLYTFLCRNYRPGDRIYAFGFSRGAFTIRVLVGMIARQGLLSGCDEKQLARYTRDAYRDFRKEFKQTGRHVDLLRKLRDGMLRTWRHWRGHPAYDELCASGNGCLRVDVPTVAFVGVWDTVAAYGLPLAELTRGVDRWVWPLSMPDYVLSPKVEKACHALALDDERDTFHPLIWDEVAEAEMRKEGKVPADRIEQVWFAGVHSDVGGGYADSGLAYVSLAWVIDKAKAVGLRFTPRILADYDALRCELAPIHDSRRGLGGYYRLQPRKIAARLKPPDMTTRIMRDPDPKTALLKTVKVHASVLGRIAQGHDRYAPTVLPADYVVVGAPTGAQLPAETNPAARAHRQEWVWNEIWRRRVNYFGTVGISLVLAAMPLINLLFPASSCLGPQCFLSPLIAGAGGFLPGFLDPWIVAFMQSPGITLGLVVALTMLLFSGGNLARHSQDRMRGLWRQSLGMPADTSAGVPAVPPDPSNSFIYRLRTHPGYQGFFRSLKWHVVPNGFGWATLLLGLFGLLAVPMLTFYRARTAVADLWTDRICEFDTALGEPPGAWKVDRACWPTGYRVEKDRKYRVILTVTQQWMDGDVKVSPTGEGVEDLPFYVRVLGIPSRRSLNEPWFQPLARIDSDGLHDRLTGAYQTALQFVPLDVGNGRFGAEFVAPQSGDLFLTVNDAVLSWTGLDDRFYHNNTGTADVEIQLRE